MALIGCPDCSKQISDTADCCPNCGFKLTEDIVSKIKEEGELKQKSALKTANHCVTGCMLFPILLFILVIATSSDTDSSVDNEREESYSSRSVDASKNKNKELSGWILRQCKVYSAASPTSTVVGVLRKPSAVIVVDEGNGWLRIIHGPIQDANKLNTDEFIEIDRNLYIQSVHFSTSMP